jgi:hypothetical protein
MIKVNTGDDIVLDLLELSSKRKLSICMDAIVFEKLTIPSAYTSVSLVLEAGSMVPPSASVPSGWNSSGA